MYKKRLKITKEIQNP